MRRATTIDNIGDSGVFLAILSGTVDEKLSMELGAAVLLDKTIIAICINGHKPNKKLKSIINEIIYVDGHMDDIAAKAVRRAVMRLHPK